MEQFETIIKLALKEDIKGRSLEKSSLCPSESDLAAYLSGSLRGKMKQNIDVHLSECLACMEDILLAQEVADLESKKESGVKDLFKKWFRKNVWLLLAITSFALSFIYPRYFIQFLIATLVLSGKWIFETVNAKILIMIYDAWKRGGEKEVARVLERHSNRIKTE